MNKAIQSILGDLYKLDPKLKKSEKDLVPLLHKLVEAKPHIKLDSSFVKNLRNQLMVRANELMETERPIKANWFSRFLAPLMGGAVAFAALMIGLMVWNGQLDFAQKPESIPQPTSMALRTALPPATPEPTSAPEAGTSAKPAPTEPSEPLVEAPAPAPATTPAPAKILKRETVKPPTILQAPKPEEVPASAPMMLQAVPTEEGAGDDAAPAPKATLKSADMATAGVSNVGIDPIAYAQSALKRAKAGERKITVSSTQIGFRSPQAMINLNFDNLPAGFTEIVGALPADYKAFVDYAGGTPQYYIYFEKNYQWYGPF